MCDMNGILVVIYEWWYHIRDMNGDIYNQYEDSMGNITGI